MIPFSCPKCSKSFLRPNRDSGREIHCPGCGEAVVVPLPPLPRKRGHRVWPLLLVAAAVSAALYVGYQKYLLPSEAEVFRKRFTGQLKALSPQWRGAEWETCEPDPGNFRLTAHYDGEKGLYQFKLARHAVLGETTVAVDPTRANPRGLAFAAFGDDGRTSFTYQGRDETERERLHGLAAELDDLLRQVRRQK